MNVVAFLVLAVTVVAIVAAVGRRMQLHHAWELRMAQAVGRNVGMTVKELDAMRHWDTTYDHGRLTKFTCELPAHLLGELHAPDKRADVEATLRATIRGVMGHVTVDFDHALPERAHGTVTLTRAEVPKPIPTSVDAAKLLPTGPLLLPIGLAAGSRQINWNIRPKGAGVAHALIYGATGSGKTEVIKTVALKAMDRGHQVFVADPKADDFEEWREQNICPVATEPGSITAIVAMVRRERERRIRDYRKTKRMNLLASGELPSILLVVDEMQALLSMVGWTKSKGAPVMDDLLNLAQQGRSAGIHLLIGTQYPRVDAVGGGDFRNQLEMVVALGNLKTEARGLTGISSSLTAYPPGRGIVAYPGTEIEVQVGLSEPRAEVSTVIEPTARVRANPPVNGFEHPGVECLEQAANVSMSAPANKGLPPPLSEDVVARIVELRAEDWPLRRIAAEVGVSVAAVHKYAKTAAEDGK